MYKIHEHLVYKWTTNDWLLCDNWGVASASSQPQRPCLGYVMKENRSPFMRSLQKLRTFKGRTNAGIVIDGVSIFDIQVINVVPHKTLIADD